MPGVSLEQVARAREIDLLSYLKAYEPHELKRAGPNRYTTETHGSLVISNGKWIWNQGQVGGYNALDYLMKVRSVGFVEAVEMLTGERAVSARSYQLEEKAKPLAAKKPFALPEPAKFAVNAVAYLQSRGISPEVINQCLQAGIVYESKKYQNVVFVGRDEAGEARFACVRGTKDDFKIDVAGSEKRYSFKLPAENQSSTHLAVFEAPIDVLSHASLQQRNGWGFDIHRLSLGGTSQTALVAFLERNPHIKRVTLHLDNDAAGLNAAKKIKAMLAGDKRFSCVRVTVNPPHAEGCKDYNDVLLNAISIEREQKNKCRYEAAI